MRNGGESLDAQGKMMWLCKEKDAPTVCVKIIQSRFTYIALDRIELTGTAQPPGVKQRDWMTAILR